MKRLALLLLIIAGLYPSGSPAAEVRYLPNGESIVTVPYPDPISTSADWSSPAWADYVAFGDEVRAARAAQAVALTRVHLVQRAAQWRPFAMFRRAASCGSQAQPAAGCVGNSCKVR